MYGKEREGVASEVWYCYSEQEEIHQIFGVVCLLYQEEGDKLYGKVLAYKVRELGSIPDPAG